MPRGWASPVRAKSRAGPTEIPKNREFGPILGVQIGQNRRKPTKIMRDVNRIPAFTLHLQRQLRGQLEALGEDVLEQIDKGFERGVDAQGHPWEPLAASTIASKGHAKILEDTGDLRDSFETNVEYDRLQRRYTLTITSDSEILPYHEFGAPDVGLPKRPVLTPAGAWADERLPNTMGDALDESIKRSIILGL